MNLHKTHYGLVNFNKITPAKFLINPSDLLQIELEMSFFFSSFRKPNLFVKNGINSL